LDESQLLDKFDTTITSKFGGSNLEIDKSFKLRNENDINMDKTQDQVLKDSISTLRSL